MRRRPTVVIGKKIEIEGFYLRHEIVRKVVNTFIDTEYHTKGKGVIFWYPVEKWEKGCLFISRPGHKKNFDFKVEVNESFGLGGGTHLEIAQDLRKKKEENRCKFRDLLSAIREIYTCSENNVDKILGKYGGLNRSFQTGAEVGIFLKVVKWLFIMEDIVYWDNEGRAFLFNFIIYVAEETDEKRLNEAIGKVKNPDRLKSFMKKAGIKWIPCEI